MSSHLESLNFLPGLQCLDGTLMDLTWNDYVLGATFSRGRVSVYNEGRLFEGRHYTLILSFKEPIPHIISGMVASNQ